MNERKNAKDIGFDDLIDVLIQGDYENLEYDSESETLCLECPEWKENWEGTLTGVHFYGSHEPRYCENVSLTRLVFGLVDRFKHSYRRRMMKKLDELKETL